MLDLVSFDQNSELPSLYIGCNVCRLSIHSMNEQRLGLKKVFGRIELMLEQLLQFNDMNELS